MKECTGCGRKVEKLYMHYMNNNIIKCICCIDGGEFEAGMGIEVK